MSKSSNNKLLGGTLLLAGTAMGGGLLALPLTNSATGFFHSSLLMIFCWSLMTATALLTLEASLWSPPGANIISMTAKLLKPEVTYLAWFSYLLLFYSIMAAYIGTGSGFLSQFGQGILPDRLLQPIATCIFTGILGGLVYRGIKWVDYLNRSFMIIKLLLYSGLVALILPYSSPNQWYAGDASKITHGFSTVITAFAYTNMIPSLRNYFQEDIRSLRQAILIGSALPLICYLLWNLSVMGIIPLSGNPGLIELSHASSPVNALIDTINDKLSYAVLPLLSKSFAYSCVFTTLLTCSFGLSDFIADGLQLKKHASFKDDVQVYGATFAPPFLIALFFPGTFVTALRYAGVYCLILFALIPVILAWRGRYHLNLVSPYRLPGGKLVLILLGLTSFSGLLYSLYQVIC